jgi:hypothetical protein
MLHSEGSDWAGPFFQFRFRAEGNYNAEYFPERPPPLRGGDVHMRPRRQGADCHGRQSVRWLLSVGAPAVMGGGAFVRALGLSRHGLDSLTVVPHPNGARGFHRSDSPTGPIIPAFAPRGFRHGRSSRALPAAARRVSRPGSGRSARDGMPSSSSRCSDRETNSAQSQENVVIGLRQTRGGEL